MLRAFFLVLYYNFDRLSSDYEPLLYQMLQMEAKENGYLQLQFKATHTIKPRARLSQLREMIRETRVTCLVTFLATDYKH